MKRITVSVDDALLDAARADVAAGRAPSVSAWVGDAMRRRVLARMELVSELHEMAAEQPYDTATVDWVSQALGRPPEWVAEQLAAPTQEHRRAG